MSSSKRQVPSGSTDDAYSISYAGLDDSADLGNPPPPIEPPSLITIPPAKMYEGGHQPPTASLNDIKELIEDRLSRDFEEKLMSVLLSVKPLVSGIGETLKKTDTLIESHQQQTKSRDEYIAYLQKKCFCEKIRTGYVVLELANRRRMAISDFFP